MTAEYKTDATPVTDDQADGLGKELLDGAREKLGSCRTCIGAWPSIRGFCPHICTATTISARRPTSPRPNRRWCF